ncbi:MAG TPA: FHA domain-containing protein [Gemmataceae bacterium]|nr:FHA domain-containing protein [Gemmataceae bacterium]
MKLSLVVKAAGKMAGQVLPITLSQFVVGRDPQCHLRPASPMISKRHCALLQRDGKAFIRDFGSTNGTFLNDQPIKDEVELQNNDRLKIGPLLFEVRLAQETAVARGATPKPPTKAVGAKPGTMAATKAGKTPPPPSKTPATTAATAEEKAAEESGGSADDDIAAMLLSLHDDDRASGLDGVVPEGSTIMDLTVPPPGADDPNKPAEKGKDKEKPKPSGNTSSAAKSILEQYMKRPRS